MSEDPIEYLRRKGAENIEHSGGSFFQHLLNTSKLLSSWGCPSDVCNAGLFHSVYGTEFFDKPIAHEDEREVIQRLIGKNAEYLAYLFCVSLRSDSFIDAVLTNSLQNRRNGQFMPIDDETLLALLKIECANLIEQGSGHEFLKKLLANGNNLISARAPEISNVIQQYLYSSATRVGRALQNSSLLVVRKASPRDSADILQLARELHVESRYAQMHFDYKIAASSLQRYIESSERCCFVVEVGGQVVAFLCGRVESLGFSAHNVAFVDYLYGKHSFRGLLALRLLLRFKAWVGTRNVLEVNLLNWLDNDKSRNKRLFMKLGMVERGELLSFDISNLK